MILKIDVQIAPSFCILSSWSALIFWTKCNIINGPFSTELVIWSKGYATAELHSVSVLPQISILQQQVEWSNFSQIYYNTWISK